MGNPDQLGKEAVMNQCLHCNQLCPSTVLFCDSCRSLLKQQNALLEQKDDMHPSWKAGVAHAQAHATNDRADIATIEPPDILGAPPSATEQGYEALTVEQTLNRLNRAAEQIDAFDLGHRRRPRASRLARYRDISLEIHRHSTPMPQVGGLRSFLQASKTYPLPALQTRNQSDKMLQGWPWLDDDDDIDHDAWANRSDPLAIRKLPDGAEGRRIDQEDIRRARQEGYVIVPFAGHSVRVRLSLLRVTVFVLIGLALFGLVADGFLAFEAFFHSRQSANSSQGGPPVMMLSANKVSYGQTITVHMAHFSASANVFLSRDINEAVKTDLNTSFIRMGPDGSRVIQVFIDDTWDPGPHTLEAEDMTTRYTASANILVESGPTVPPRLVLSVNQLDFGADMQGTNTIRTVRLHNSGGGIIAWSASSNQPWLLVTPNQGVFSDSQPLIAGVQRINLKPGSYAGAITVTSNVGASQKIRVTMVVRPLPKQPGALLSATPVTQSFVAADGGSNPAMQYLTISNPGNQMLFWSLTSNTPYNFPGQGPTPNANWLELDQISGVVLAGSSVRIGVHASSTNLLPGLYINTLIFSSTPGHTTLDTPQNVVISLTVQPHCGIALNAGSMSFTAVGGQGNPGNQALGVTTTSSCNSILQWQASTSANWVVLQPASGQLRNGSGTNVAVGVNTAGLKAGNYSAVIIFVAAQTTQSVMVQLTVQSPPPPGAPIMAVSPLNLNFSTTQGQGDPPGQTVTVTNTGKSQLSWHDAANVQVPSWLRTVPASGSISPGQSVQMIVNVSASGLTPGIYSGQIVLSGVDTHGVVAGGSPQALLVNFTVQAPCSLSQLPASVLTFGDILQDTVSVTPQSMTLTATGNCSWPLNWSVHVIGAAPWLTLSNSSGSFMGSGQFGTFLVGPNVVGLPPGSYSARVSVIATGSSGLAAQGSGQSFTVSFTVVQPCSLQVSSSSVSMSATLAQSAVTTRTLSINQVGSCSQPLSWTIMTAATVSPWLSASPTSGTGSGTVTLTANAASLPVGTLTQPGAITVLDTTDPLGPSAPVATVSVTLTVQ